jgi:hypothetical protein
MIAIISFLTFTSIVAIVAHATARTRYQGFNYQGFNFTKLPTKQITLETIPVTLTKLTKKQAKLLAKQ